MIQLATSWIIAACRDGGRALLGARAVMIDFEIARSEATSRTRRSHPVT